MNVQFFFLLAQISPLANKSSPFAIPLIFSFLFLLSFVFRFIKNLKKSPKKINKKINKRKRLKKKNPLINDKDELFFTFERRDFNFGNDDSDNGNSLEEFMSLDANFQVIEDTQVRFSDIAGNKEAKAELQEVVTFLKSPDNYLAVGAAVPKGVLLGGPPGTGKTLLAKAIAGEANTPFLKVSGSQFVELLIGVGAARVRELFEKAYELKPSIIFIDEIDSIARTRGRGGGVGGGASDEREQTLNQLLNEMDGFKSTTGVVVIGATNRTDILDPAILRPGRFDRQITMVNPNLAERQEILQVHARGKKLDTTVSLAQVAQRTIGFSGADLANVLNEAAILATRLKKITITMKEINTSIDRIVVGLEGDQVLRVKSRQLTAFHEMGHAFLGSINAQKEGIEKITIVPRGNAQGITWTTPSLRQYNSREKFMNQIFTAIAGRAAEEMVSGYGECTVGAQQDLYRMTRYLRTMILRYAMTRLQEVKQKAQYRNLYYLGSDVKQELNNVIDSFTTNLMDSIYQEVLLFLRLLRPSGERIVDQLLEVEEVNSAELGFAVREYISLTSETEVIATSRESLMFNRIVAKIKQSFGEMEGKIDKFLEVSIIK